MQVIDHMGVVRGGAWEQVSDIAMIVSAVVGRGEFLGNNGRKHGSGPITDPVRCRKTRRHPVQILVTWRMFVPPASGPPPGAAPGRFARRFAPGELASIFSLCLFTT
ncbi:hypothetical protein [Rhodopila globiformis]|uniref:hypothetical protein n=1 Tax=Rhodopila globiformis TaxID=1071 RepID=UPI0011B0D034|nr:hypothetical protein [Rhodopila globiformis]